MLLFCGHSHTSTSIFFFFYLLSLTIKTSTTTTMAPNPLYLQAKFDAIERYQEWGLTPAKVRDSIKLLKKDREEIVRDDFHPSREHLFCLVPFGIDWDDNNKEFVELQERRSTKRSAPSRKASGTSAKRRATSESAGAGAGAGTVAAPQPQSKPPGSVSKLSPFDELLAEVRLAKAEEERAATLDELEILHKEQDTALAELERSYNKIKNLKSKLTDHSKQVQDLRLRIQELEEENKDLGEERNSFIGSASNWCVTAQIYNLSLNGAIKATKLPDSKRPPTVPTGKDLRASGIAAVSDAKAYTQSLGVTLHINSASNRV